MDSWEREKVTGLLACGVIGKAAILLSRLWLAEVAINGRKMVA
ncbi:MAG: hypothetical protein V4731_02690 [Pseudomonadota bacterium]